MHRTLRFVLPFGLGAMFVLIIQSLFLIVNSLTPGVILTSYYGESGAITVIVEEEIVSMYECRRRGSRVSLPPLDSSSTNWVITTCERAEEKSFENFAIPSAVDRPVQLPTTDQEDA
jgi:hypothetical protein